MEIDARGETCPIPVIKTKNALKQIQEGVVTVLVDNKIATENLQKMADKLNFDIDITKIDKDYKVTIIKGTVQITSQTNINNNINNNIAIVISSDKMGVGEDELGKSLMKAFIYSLTEQEILPQRIIFYNYGVKITTVNSQMIDDLKKLESLGVKIYSCGACLNFYKLEDSLLVGEVTNLYSVSEYMLKAEKVINI